MSTIKQIFIDSLNGFRLDLIPLFLFQLLVAALLGLLMEKILNRKLGEGTIERGALISTLSALLTSIVKYSLPYSVLAAAIILLFSRQKEFQRDQTLSIVLILGLGMGCGVGSVFQTFIGFILLALIIWFLPLKK